MKRQKKTTSKLTIGILIPFFMILLFLPMHINAQKKSSIDTLSQQQIQAFEKTSENIFYELENLTLIILDESEDRDIRYEAKYLAQLFFSSKANIEDDLGSGENFNNVFLKDNYFKSLLELADEKNEFSKEFTLIDVEEFEPKWSSINLENNDTFRVYQGALNYIDYTAISDIIPESNLSPENTYTRKNQQYKHMILEIRKTVIPSVKWQLFIRSIKVLEKKDLAFKAAKKSNKISDNQPTSTRLIKTKPIAEIKKGILIDSLITEEFKRNLDSTLLASSKSDSPDLELRSFRPYLGLNVTDFVLPGKGHLKFNRNGNAWVSSSVYTILGAGTLGSAIYFKVRSNKFYDNHLKATTFDVLDTNYNKANELHHYYLISAGAAILVWTTNAVDLLIKNKKYKPADSYSLQIVSPSNGNPGLGVVLNF